MDTGQQNKPTKKSFLGVFPSPLPPLVLIVRRSVVRVGQYSACLGYGIIPSIIIKDSPSLFGDRTSNQDYVGDPIV